MKPCACCRQEKDEKEFCKSKHTSDGLHCYCRACSKEKRKKYSAADWTAWKDKWRKKQGPEAMRERWRKQYASNPEAGRLKARKHWDALPPEVRKARRRKQVLAAYGLTSADYDKMLSAQGGGCAICEATDPNHWTGQFHIDHCHDEGTVRGLLCHNCNSAIGHLRDDPRLLRSAIGYIERSRKPRLRIV